MTIFAAPLLIRNARLVTPQPHWPCRGPQHSSLIDRPACDVLCVEGRIESIRDHHESIPAPHNTTVIEAAGRVLLPGFIDCHTHACFAGDRFDEWRQRLQGDPYLAILARGGGIMSTVQAVRASSQAELTALLRARLALALRQGTTTIEIKSGYGLTMPHELAMLRAIRACSVAQHSEPSLVAPLGWQDSYPTPGIVPTALLGHAIDPETPNFTKHTIHATLDAVHAEFPGITIDAFCEKGAWSVGETVALFERARSLGHPLRVHADQFTSLGMIEKAIALGARSVDHLESSTPEDLRRLGESSTIAVGLPITALHLATPPSKTDPAQPTTPFPAFANLRAVIDAGGAAAIATNFNPGSGPSLSMPLAIALASRFCGLSVEEAITAATINPAAVLGLTDRGCITKGARADLILLRTTDPRHLGYELGGDPVTTVIVAGTLARDDIRD